MTPGLFHFLLFFFFFLWYDCQVLTLRGQVWSQIFNITLTLYTLLQWGLECFIYVGLWLGFLLFFCFMDLSFHLGKKKNAGKITISYGIFAAVQNVCPRRGPFPVLWKCGNDWYRQSWGTQAPPPFYSPWTPFAVFLY